MRIRGRRRCVECGETWSYYETGDVACPACGSLRSVGRDAERRLHTDAPASLDLAPVRSLIDEAPLRDAAETAESAARDYVRSKEFVRGGELLPLDDVYVAASELRHVAAHLRREPDPDDRCTERFLALLAGAEDGRRPDDDPPPPLRWAWGLATAAAAEGYRRDLSSWLREHPDPDAVPVLERLRSHARRIEALDGEVAPTQADGLVGAARDLGRYLRVGDEGALALATERLDRLDGTAGI